MSIETILTDQMIQNYTQKGFWKNRLWTDYIRENARRSPNREAVVDRKYRLTFQQYKEIIKLCKKLINNSRNAAPRRPCLRSYRKQKLKECTPTMKN